MNCLLLHTQVQNELYTIPKEKEKSNRGLGNFLEHPDSSRGALKCSITKKEIIMQVKQRDQVD